MSKTDFQNGFALGLASGGVVEVEKSLPDWDDDSPIIATNRAHDTDNVYWELTEKGSFRWKIKDTTDGHAAKYYEAGLGGSALSQIQLEYQAIAPKIKQIDVAEGIRAVGANYAANCERVRLPSTLIENPNFSQAGLKEIDISKFTFTSLSDYWCSSMFRLEKVVLPSTITTLPQSVFQTCYSLNEINLDNITVFRTRCFHEDFSLNCDVVFNPNLTTIDALAFYRTRIKSVKFQNSIDNLPTVANNVFGQCRELTDIYCPWAEGAVANAPWGATNATIHYNWVEGE